MSQADQVPLTVVIAARNEAANIRECIESVRGAGEVLVVEDGSTDETARIARDAGATVIQREFTTIGEQRNAGIERAAFDWVLVLDADERASPELVAEVARVTGNAAVDAWRIPRENIFLGRRMRHGGWGSDRPVRLFRRQLRYDASRVHEHVVTAGMPGELRAGLVHEPYASMDEWFEKLDRYSRWWAEDRFERGRKAGALSVVIRPPLRFLRMYVLRGGWMDGAPGAILAVMAGISVAAKYARLWAMWRAVPRTTA